MSEGGSGGRRYAHPTDGPRRQGSNFRNRPVLEEPGSAQLARNVTPFAAGQSMPAQHGATVVRTSSQQTQNGPVMFYSSIQKKGGSFTASEREAENQITRGRRRWNETGNTPAHHNRDKTKARFEGAKRKREVGELTNVEEKQKKQKRGRFDFSDSSSDV